MTMDPKDVHWKRRELRRLNQMFTEEFVDFPCDKWPHVPPERGIRTGIKRNRDFLVQIFEEPTGWRLSVNRCELNKDGGWVDGITWDHLFWIKNQVGFANHDAVEIYPRKADLVYVSNIRHLWVMREPLPYGWRSSQPETNTTHQHRP